MSIQSTSNRQKPPPTVNWAAVGLSILFGLVMFRCSFWQWNRYKEKVKLLATFKENAISTALPIPAEAVRTDKKPIESAYNTAQELRYKMVTATGRFDFDRQIIITNRKNADGPGHLLLAPFEIEGADHFIMVSRGFIPYAEREPTTWTKYGTGKSETQKIYGIMQEAKLPKTIGPSNPSKSPTDGFQRIYFFEEVARMADEMNIPLARDFFIQQVGGPVIGRYPEEAISIQVPPSTHFGYTIEWALLGTLTLVVGLGKQYYNFRRARSFY
jgi:cytochrome oxidase assembly protein ShyY1